MLQNRAILTIGDQKQALVVRDLSNGATFSVPERTLTQISKARYYMMPNISETVPDTDIVTMK